MHWQLVGRRTTLSTMLPDEPSHPLDPLTPQELQQAIEIVRKEKALTRDHLFVFTLLAEPSKAALKAWGRGQPIDRAARITVWDRAAGLLIESVVGLDGTVRRWDPQPGQKAALLGPEAAACLDAAKGGDCRQTSHGAALLRDQ